MNHSSWIEVATADGPMGAYLALPPTGTGPGIVLIQEIFGINAHIRSVADQYAADGFVVIAPDLFWRRSPRIELGYTDETMKEGFGHLLGIGFPTLSSDVASAAKALRERPEVTGKIASIGFCAGGTLSFLAAADGVVDLAVSYYGGGTQNFIARAESVNVPMLFHFGTADSHISPEAVATIEGAFAGRSNVEFHHHEGAEHGFNCWARGSYSQPSALEARGQTLSFLAANKVGTR